MDNSAINRTEFKGELYDDIVKSLKETFANVYPGYEIEVQYVCERRNDNKRFFYVYLKGETFGVRDEIPMLKPHLVFVDKYVNSDAIFFSEHSRKKFEETFDEYNEQNYETLRKGLQALKEEFAGKIAVSNIRVDQHGYSFEFNVIDANGGIKSSSSYGYSRSNYVRHHFSYSPISKKTAQSAISKAKREIKYSLQRAGRL